jgi:hypothetical protein
LVYKNARGALTVDSQSLLYPSYNLYPTKKPITQPYQIQVAGLTLSLENSFILGYFLPQKNKRFRWGDSFLGSLSLGEQYSNIPGAASKIWGAYRFEIGLVAEFSIRENFKIYGHLKPLVYEKDVLSPFISGSSLGFELVASPLFFGANVLARDSRIVGFIPVFTQPSVNAHDFEFNMGYHFHKNREIQIKSRWYNASSGTHVDQYPNQNLQQDFTFQIVYGWHF